MSREDFEGIRDYAKKQHQERVAKNPQRLEYAVKLLRDNGITFKVCNEATGQINCYFADGKCLTFYAGTGKIQGYVNVRGIRAFIRLCKNKKMDDKIKVRFGGDNGKTEKS